MIPLVALLPVVVHGISAGVLLGSLVGPVPLLRSLGPEAYLRAKQFLTPRYDPAMPILVVANIVVDVATVVLVPVVAARVCFAAGAVVLVAMVVVSVTRNVPVNNWEMSLDPADAAEQLTLADPRPAWHHWHRVRTGLLVAALAAGVGGCVSALTVH